MNAIEIIFTGIVYLLDPSGGTPQMQVVIPNASAPSAPFGHVIPDHYAYVKIRTKDVDNFWDDTDERHPDFVYRKDYDSDSDEVALYALTGDDISITGLKEKPLTACVQDGQCASLGDVNPADRYSWEYIPDQDKVCGTLCQPLDPVFLRSELPELVSARMLLTHGELSSAGVSKDAWRFKPAHHQTNSENDYYVSRIADQAVLFSETEADYATLEITPFDDGKAQVDTLKLTLKAGAHVEIGNMMPNDILPMKAQHPPETVDFHFGLYYTLLSQPIPKDPPVPHHSGPLSPSDAGPHQNCSPLKKKG